MIIKKNKTKYQKGACANCGGPAKLFVQVLPKRDLLMSECPVCGCKCKEVLPKDAPR